MCILNLMNLHSSYTITLSPMVVNYGTKADFLHRGWVEDGQASVLMQPQL